MWKERRSKKGGMNIEIERQIGLAADMADQGNLRPVCLSAYL